MRSDSENLFYLRSHVSGEPLKLIESLAISNDNFQVALDLLNNRYNNVRQILANHFNQLLSIPESGKCTVANLKEFITNAQSTYESLLTLDYQSKELFVALISQIISLKLDYQSRKAFEEQTSHNFLNTPTNLFEFLNNRCMVMESIQTVQPKVESTKNGTQNQGTPRSNRVCSV